MSFPDPQYSCEGLTESITESLGMRLFAKCMYAAMFIVLVQFSKLGA